MCIFPSQHYYQNKLKLAIIGQSQFGQEVYTSLRKQGHKVVGVFTVPDKDGKADPLGELLPFPLLYAPTGASACSACLRGRPCVAPRVRPSACGLQQWWQETSTWLISRQPGLYNQRSPGPTQVAAPPAAAKSAQTRQEVEMGQ